MTASIPTSTLEKFTTFGDLLRYLRRRAGLTQTELSIAAGYSTAQISRLEQNLRLPDLPTVEARFPEALALEDEPEAVARLLDLAANVRREDAPSFGVCPYKGLNYFDENDADIFIGREALTEGLVDRVMALTTSKAGSRGRFLAVVGASGSGKSSLVRAGLVPALHWNKKSADWPVQILTPTARPLESLAESLAGEGGSVTATAALIDDLAREPRSLHLYATRESKSPKGSRLVLVIDQFEELFALCRSDEERVAFINNLLTAASERDGPVIVVITLRADFYAHCAAYPELREALAGQQEYIGAMSEAELRRAIVEPAERGRWELEPGLVDQLLHDVGSEPGGLPLLSHALLETWQRRRGRTMTLGGYASSGGVRGAIAETAEEVFTDQFSHEQQAIARRIFLRLTELGEETSTGDTRRRATFDELVLKPEETDATRAVLTALADARLITISEDAAEVAHEALIREWPTLRGWLEDNREGLRLHRQLTEAAQEWSETGRDPDALYRGSRLAQTRDWGQANEADLNALEKEFLAASVDASQREADEREAQRQRELEAAQKLAETERRASSRLRRRAYLLAAALALAIVLAGMAAFLGNRADKSAQLATSRELALSANANLSIDPELSMLLALRALSLARIPEAESALHNAVQADRAHLTLKHDAGVCCVFYDHDGTRLATVSDQGIVRIWDPATGQELHSFPVPQGGPIKLSQDGTRLAMAYRDDAGLWNAGIWDTASGEQLLTMPAQSWINDVAFSPDGTRLATAHDDHTAKVWDSRTGKELLTFRGHSDYVWTVDFSPDGTRVASSGEGFITKVWDSGSGKEILTLDGAYGTFTRDGKGIRTKKPEQLRLWDATTGQKLYDLPWGAEDFSPDGTRLIGQDPTGWLKVWDLATGAELLSFPAHEAGIGGIAVAPDGIHVATSSADGTVKVWDLRREASREWLTIDMPGWHSLAYSPDGTRLATSGPDNTAIIWDAQTGKKLVTFTGHTMGVGPVAFSPDGSRLATSSADGTARVWEAATGKELLTLSKAGHGDGLIGSMFSELLDVAFSPDGKLLATAGADGTAILWDAKSGQPLRTLDNQGIGIFDLAFSPDGTRLATGAGDSDLEGHLISRVWDVATGKELLSIDTAGIRVFGLAFSPDGERLATGDQDQMAQIWDAKTGRELLSLPIQPSWVDWVAFSPDGSQLATAGADGTTRLWDASTGEELLTLRQPIDYPGILAFSPDGTRLATMSDAVRVYLLNIDDLIALAKSRLSRSLTGEECQKYLHVDQCPPEP